MIIADLIAINVFAHAQRATPPITKEVLAARQKQKAVRRRAWDGFQEVIKPKAYEPLLEKWEWK